MGAAHESTPDSASEPTKATWTAWLYQPFASGWRSAFASTAGAVASYFSEYVVLLVSPAPFVHVPETEASD